MRQVSSMIHIQDLKPRPKEPLHSGCWDVEEFPISLSIIGYLGTAACYEPGIL